MHRLSASIPAATVRLLAVIALALTVMSGTALGQEATPAASPTPDYSYEVDSLGVAAIVSQPPAAGDEEPVATPEPEPVKDQQVALTRVTLEPGQAVEPTRPHQGSSVLFVEQGAICYQLHDAQGASIVLFTPDLDDVGAETEVPESGSWCPRAPEECADAVFGCDLVAIGVSNVQVHAGQSILQSTAPESNVIRGYTNIGTEPAIIWIAQVQTEPEAAPCGGGCP